MNKYHILLFLILTFLLVSDIFTKIRDKKKKKKKSKKYKKKKEPTTKAPKPKPDSFPEEPNNVQMLYKNNTNVLLSDPISKSLVFVYSSFNRHNQAMSKAFNSLSLIKDKVLENMQFYKGDSKQLFQLVDSNHVYELPAVLLYLNDQNIVYVFEGDKSPDMLLRFVKTMVHIQIHEIKTPEDLDRIKKVGSNILIVGDPQKFKNEFNLISKYSRRYYKNTMWTKHPFFFKKFNIPKNGLDAVAYFTVNRVLNSGERMNISLKDLNKDAVERVSEVYSRRPYSLLTLHKLEQVLANHLKTVIYFYHKTDEKLDASLKKLAQKYRGQYWFLFSKHNRDAVEAIKETFQLKNAENEPQEDYEKKFPYFTIVDNITSHNIDLDMYQMEQSAPKTEETIEKFIEDHKNKKLKRLFISEINMSEQELKMIEEERKEHASYSDSDNYQKTVHNHLIHHTIGNNFHGDMFKNPTKDVVMYVYSDTENSLKFTRRFKRVVKRLAQSKNIFWANTNYFLNELEGLQIKKIPSLFIVPDIDKGNQNKTPILFEGEFTSSNIVAFIQKHAKNLVEVTSTSKDNNHKKQEEEKKIEAKSVVDEEHDLDVMLGYKSGNGFTSAVRRYAREYETSKKEKQDEIHDQDYDEEEYDLEEERGFYKEDIKGDL